MSSGNFRLWFISKCHTYITKTQCHIYVSLLLLGKKARRRRLNGKAIHCNGGKVEEG